MSNSLLTTPPGASVGPPAALTIPEILSKILAFVVSAEPIPLDPVRDQTKSTLSKQAVVNLRNVLLVCRQWYVVGTRVHLWPISWSNLTVTSPIWWDQALGLTAETKGRCHQRLVCYFEGQALVRDSIWSKKYVWKDENQTYWLQWLDDMRRIQQHAPSPNTNGASSLQATDAKGGGESRLNIKELVLTGHLEVHTHVSPLLALRGIADHITLLELKFHHYTILDPRLFFHVATENQYDTHECHELPPIPNLRHLLLGKVQLRASRSLLRHPWAPRQPSILQTLSLDCMADPRLTAAFLLGVCGPQTRTLQLFSFPLVPSSSDTPQGPLTTGWTGPQPNVAPPSGPLQEQRQLQPRLMSTIDLLLHVSARAPNVARISIESANTVQMLLTLSRAYPRAELIENDVSRYTLESKECSTSLSSSRSLSYAAPTSMSSSRVSVQSSPPLHPCTPQLEQGLPQSYFLTSIKIPIWRGGNVEAGHNLDDLVMDSSGFGYTSSTTAIGAQLVDPEWSWFQLFQSEHARFLKELQLPSHMLAVGYLDPAICPRWACTDLEELVVEFYPGRGRNTAMAGSTWRSSYSRSRSNNSSSSNSNGNSSSSSGSSSGSNNSRSSPTHTFSVSSMGTGGMAMMASPLEMSRRVLSFIVTSFPRLRRLTVWRSCVNVSDQAGGFCFLSRLPDLESLTLKSNQKHLWFWPRSSDMPFEEQPRWLLAHPSEQDWCKGKTSLQVCRAVAALDEGRGYFDTLHGRAMLWPSDASHSGNSSSDSSSSGSRRSNGGGHESDSQTDSDSSGPLSLPSPLPPSLPLLQHLAPENGCLWRNMQGIHISVLEHTDDREEYLVNTCAILRTLRPDIKCISSSCSVLLQMAFGCRSLLLPFWTGCPKKGGGSWVVGELKEGREREQERERGGKGSQRK